MDTRNTIHVEVEIPTDVYDGAWKYAEKHRTTLTALLAAKAADCAAWARYEEHPDGPFVAQAEAGLRALEQDWKMDPREVVAWRDYFLESIALHKELNAKAAK